MARDVKEFGSAIGTALETIAHEVSDSVSSDGAGHSRRNGSNGTFKGMRGVAAGAALATAVPVAGRVVKKLAGAKGAVEDKVGEATDVPGMAKEAGKKMMPSLPGLGGKGKKGGGDDKGVKGVGKGRRMPVQQAADIGVPLKEAYNQWTQFEEWPQFMHRLDQATQEDDSTVSFRTKIWGMSKEFVGQIEEQRPDERIQWSVNEGVVHNGVVTFHELAPRLTRVQVSLDVEPGSWIEKAGRGMRHVKRAVRGDLARFKAFIEMKETASGAWRGTIHEGELVKQKTSGSSGSKSSTSKKSNSRGSGGGSRSRAKSSRSRSKTSSKRR